MHAGKDGARPTMRLGFADHPPDYADVFWSGEKIPEPKRRRRKGRAVKP